MMIGGVPIGTDDYIAASLAEKADEIVGYIEATVASLSDHPHALWAALYYSYQTRFDFWLRHLEPYQYHTRTPASRIDDALQRAAESMTYAGCFTDPHTSRRFHLPARHRGCGIRRRVELAPIAFAAC